MGSEQSIPMILPKEWCGCLAKKQTVVPQDNKGRKKKRQVELTHQESSSSEDAELRDTPMDIFNLKLSRNET